MFLNCYSRFAFGFYLGLCWSLNSCQVVSHPNSLGMIPCQQQRGSVLSKQPFVLRKPWQLLLGSIVGFTTRAYGDDKGLIGYFDGDCPDGWELYSNLTGRVPVGIGNYSGIAEDGRVEAVAYAVGNMGGEIDHNQTVQEIPSHNHNNGVFMYLSRVTGMYTADSTDNTPNGEPDILTVEPILSVGGSQPHNNMQPYLVLTPCQKIKADNYTEQSDFIALQTNVSILQQEILFLEDQINAPAGITKVESSTGRDIGIAIGGGVTGAVAALLSVWACSWYGNKRGKLVSEVSLLKRNNNFDLLQSDEGQSSVMGNYHITGK